MKGEGIRALSLGLVLALVILSTPQLATASSSWECDFSSGSCADNGWTVYNGTFNVEDERAVATGTATWITSLGESACNYMTHPSSVTMANWSFVVRLQDNINTVVMFMAHEEGPLSLTEETCYPMLGIDLGGGDLSLCRYVYAAGYVSRTVIGDHSVSTSSGIFQISVVRTSVTDLEVYLDGDLIISEVALIPDVTYDFFGFIADDGCSIDDVVITDLSTTETTTTETTTEDTTTDETTNGGQDMNILYIAIGGGAVLIILVLVVLKTKRG
ncbi:MAG: hypothetical protein ACFE7R_05240 [Candidatus Hodarchaeota archaeon]